MYWINHDVWKSVWSKQTDLCGVVNSAVKMFPSSSVHVFCTFLHHFRFEWHLKTPIIWDAFWRLQKCGVTALPFFLEVRILLLLYYYMLEFLKHLYRLNVHQFFKHLQKKETGGTPPLALNEGERLFSNVSDTGKQRSVWVPKTLGKRKDHREYRYTAGFDAYFFPKEHMCSKLKNVELHNDF